ncbi:MAG: hypothetical protein IPK16_08330 [Anaerolineales bacterium]|nr:hypothetical protein [Anaerolineales bacterium]
MSEVIYLKQHDGRMLEMTAEAFATEKSFQKLLADYPHLLAGGQMSEENPRRWLLVGREIGIPWAEGEGSTPAPDHLLLDQDGIPTLVEVKRSTDTRIRREVVGQMLEYAANAVVYWPMEKLKSQFEATATTRKQDANQMLAEFLNAPLDDAAALDEFWQRGKTNLQAGKIRMLFVAEEIPVQLRRIVEFLNVQMSQAEVLAIEVKQFVGEGQSAFVPRLVAQTAQKTASANEQRRWDEDSFFQDFTKRNNADTARIAHKILDWARQRGLTIWWGAGKRDGSFIPLLAVDGHLCQVICLWSYGSVEIQFQYMKPPNSLDEAQRLELLARLNRIPGVKIAKEGATKRPNIPLKTLANDAVLAQFLEEVAWAFDQIKAKGAE